MTKRKNSSLHLLTIGLIKKSAIAVLLSITILIVIICGILPTIYFWISEHNAFNRAKQEVLSWEMPLDTMLVDLDIRKVNRIPMCHNGG